MADQSQQNNGDIIKFMEIGLKAEDAESGICNVVWRINDAIGDLDTTDMENVEKHVIELVKILIGEE